MLTSFQNLVNLRPAVCHARLVADCLSNTHSNQNRLGPHVSGLLLALATPQQLLIGQHPSRHWPSLPTAV